MSERRRSQLKRSTLGLLGLDELKPGGDRVKSRRKVLRVAVGLAITLAVLPLISCGGSSLSKTTASPSGTMTNPSVSASSAAAKAYFAAMAPTIELDYQGLQWFKQAMTQWQQSYGNADPSTDRQAWDALGVILQQTLPKERRVDQGYEAITPPEAFRTAHQALLENNRDGDAWDEELLAAIKASRPTSELMSKLAAGPPGPSNGTVLAEFQDAAARIRIKLPSKLIGAYSDNAGSGGQATQVTTV